MNKPNVILVGGFLGAGKTTLIGQLTRRLSAKGLRVGIVTNDQAADLVDTAVLSREGVALAEVSGGCFCCYFGDFEGKLRELRDGADVLIGEPVGSCTDLAATVVRPIQTLYTQRYRVAPYSVLVDPLRWEQSLLPRAQRTLPDNVLYIFRLQIEEADVILLNKADAISMQEQEHLLATLKERYPGRVIFVISAKTGEGLNAWLDYLLQGDLAGTREMKVDYETYAEGEAALGWLNAAATLTPTAPVDWGAWAVAFLRELRDMLQAEAAEIAHAKLAIKSPSGNLSASLTSNGGRPELGGELPVDAEVKSLIINVRAHADPEVLYRAVVATLEKTRPAGMRVELGELRRFRPGRPVPTHRIPA